MTAIILARERASLHGIGRQLDELARAGADEALLDEVLAIMRLAHSRIVRHLEAATCPAAPASLPSLHRVS